MNQIYQIVKEKIKNHDYFFISINTIREHGFHILNILSNYQLERNAFYKKTGYRLNLKNPITFNEKIIWKKIYDRNPLLPITADKHQVRFYIKEMLGEEKANEILIPHFYVTDRPETIPFNKLPPDFIVKPNHASGLKIIVKNGQFNQSDIIKNCQRWLKTRYGLSKLEWAYQPIKRKIIIEKLLLDKNGNTAKEYFFHMFNGKCKLIRIILKKTDNPIIISFDENWNLLYDDMSVCTEKSKIKKPKSYENMLKIANIIAKPFDYIRVDLYDLNGKIHIGELTHYHASGREKFKSKTFDEKLGNYWKIQPNYWKM